MNRIYDVIVENIIINIARDKYDKKIKCQCEEKFNNTIIVSLNEIKLVLINRDILDFIFEDIEYLFYENQEKKNICNFCGFILYNTNTNIPIIKRLKKRIKYDYFSRYYRKVKKIYTSQSDSGELLIVFHFK
jgi:hypothetical protein